MTNDDPGWGGMIAEEPASATAGTSAPQQPAGGPGSLLPPEGTAGALLPPDMRKIQATSPQQLRRTTLILVVIAIILGIVGGGAAGVIVALSGHHAATSTTTGTTTASNTGQEPSLLSVVPSALSGTCQQTPSSDFVTTAVTDEIACNSSSVSGSSADVIGYARFANSSAVDAYFGSLLSQNGLASGAGSCSSVDLSGSSSSGSFCEGSYTDSSGNSGNELIFLGSSFDLGGATGSSVTFCNTNFPGSSGVSAVAWTSPADDSFGFALDCTDSSSQFVEGMQSNLVHAAYGLGD